MWDRVVVRNRVNVESAVIAAGVPLTGNFRRKVEGRGPLAPGGLNDVHPHHGGKLFLGSLQLFGQKASWSSRKGGPLVGIW